MHTTSIRKCDSIISPHYYYCYYQVHHHVHRADFVWIHFIKHLLHLFKCGPRGNIMSPTLLNELPQRTHKHLLVHTAIHFGIFLSSSIYYMVQHLSIDRPHSSLLLWDSRYLPFLF